MLVKKVTKFSPQFSCYLHFLVLFFPSNPNSTLLSKQLSHVPCPGTLFRPAEDYKRCCREDKACFTAAWLFCGAISKYSHFIWIIYTDRRIDRHLHKYTQHGCILSYTGRTSEPGRIYHLKNEYSQAHQHCKHKHRDCSQYNSAEGPTCSALTD